jgi:hypothetical protein
MVSDTPRLTTRPISGKTPPGFRVVHFCVGKNLFNRSKAKAAIQDMTLAEYIANLMNADTELCLFPDSGTAE